MELVLQSHEEVRDTRVLIEEDSEEKKQEDEDGNANEGEDLSEEVLASEEKLSNEGFGIKSELLADYAPPCKIESAQAMSAIERATTRECKQEIADVACGIQEGGVYPGSLPNTCHLKGELLVDRFQRYVCTWIVCNEFLTSLVRPQCICSKQKKLSYVFLLHMKNFAKCLMIISSLKKQNIPVLI